MFVHSSLRRTLVANWAAITMSTFAVGATVGPAQAVSASTPVAADAPAPIAQSAKVPAKVYAVMTLTTVLTFATLMTGYQLLFPPHQLFG